MQDVELIVAYKTFVEQSSDIYSTVEISSSITINSSSLVSDQRFSVSASVENSDVNIAWAGDNVLGSLMNGVLVGMLDDNNVLISHVGVDMFALKATGVNTLTRTDVILDFKPLEGDRIGLTGGITVSDLHLQAVDLDHNGIPESTVIRLGASDSILAVVLNTVDAAGNTILINDCFLSIPNALEHQIVT